MTDKLNLERTREQWENCDPFAMSRMSEAAIFNALQDAKRDVLAMHAALAAPTADVRSISDEMMDLVDRLGSEWDKVDPRAWRSLLIYLPKNPETSAPEGIEDTHFLSLARMCKLVGNYTTMEQINAVVGYARVVLNDKAVQEAFVRANRAALAAPKAVEAAPTADAQADERTSEALLNMSDALTSWRKEAEKYHAVTPLAMSSFCDGYEAGMRAITLAAPKAVDTAPAASAEQSMQSCVRALQDAMEGECDGLMVSDEGATKIIQYMLSTAPLTFLAARSSSPVEARASEAEAGEPSKLFCYGCYVANPELAVKISAGPVEARVSEAVAGEPVAWMHTMDNTEGIEENEPLVVFSDEPEHPFGVPGEDFSESYPVTSVPLYTAPQTHAGEQQADRVEALEAKCRLYEASLDRADAERGALKDDAERYRWLRQDRKLTPDVFWIAGGHLVTGLGRFIGTAADAAIDAAIKSED